MPDETELSPSSLWPRAIVSVGVPWGIVGTIQLEKLPPAFGLDPNYYPVVATCFFTLLWFAIDYFFGVLKLSRVPRGDRARKYENQKVGLLLVLGSLLGLFETADVLLQLAGYHSPATQSNFYVVVTVFGLGLGAVTSPPAWLSKNCRFATKKAKGKKARNTLYVTASISFTILAAILATTLPAYFLESESNRPAVVVVSADPSWVQTDSPGSFVYSNLTIQSDFSTAYAVDVNVSSSSDFAAYLNHSRGGTTEIGLLRAGEQVRLPLAVQTSPLVRNGTYLVTISYSFEDSASRRHTGTSTLSVSVVRGGGCESNICTQQTSTLPWVWVGAAFAIIAAAMVTLLLLRRRRGGESEPEGGRLPPGGSEPAAAATEPEARSTGPVYDEGLPDQPPAEDTSVPPPSEDIDSLMNALDRISGEEK